MTSTPTEPDTTLLIQCPNCGKDFRIKASFMGQSGLCTSCGQRFTITDAAAVNPAEAPLPRPTQTNPGGEAQSDTQRPPAPSGGAIGPNSQEIAQLNARIAQLFKAGQYTEAMPPAREVCKLVREDSGAISEGYAASLRNVGAIYYKLGNKADGDKFMQTSEEVRRKLGGGETGNVDDSTSEAKTRDVDNRTGEAKTLEWEPKGVFAADDLNYCFYLPSGGWYRYGRSAEREALADMVLEKTGVGVIRVVVGQCVPGETFESLCRRVEEIYVEETPDFQQIDAGPARVAGKEAAFIEFRGRGEDLDEEIRCLSYLVERDDCFVQIIAIGVPDIFAEFRDDIGGLIESFSFDRTEILAAQELDRKMAMRKLLLPGAAAVFVPLFSILGWLISSADAHDHANNTSLGEPGVPLWWLIYPLIGYYISVGWAASGFSGCRNLRQWLTNIGAKLSAWIIMIMYAPFAAMFDSDKG
ncbi:MAG: hypothetical protein H8E53_01330, partial [Planctomycetes bacterium]|nr:hypothetical protein [Planctomycetota bacterium]